jgi:hypothetical protein
MAANIKTTIAAVNNSGTKYESIKSTATKKMA